MLGLTILEENNSVFQIPKEDNNAEIYVGEGKNDKRSSLKYRKSGDSYFDPKDHKGETSRPVVTDESKENEFIM